jgi:hypothetical protein
MPSLIPNVVEIFNTFSSINESYNDRGMTLFQTKCAVIAATGCDLKKV